MKKLIDFQREAEAVITKITQNEYIKDTDNTKYAFRTSSLSLFCPVYLAFNMIYGKTVKETFMQDFYTESGSTVHSVIQKWGPLYGKWKCNKCKKITKGWGPKTCCNTLKKYIEYSLKYRGLTGHCDGIIKILKYLFILEIKTIQQEHMAKMSMPEIHHIKQANIYAVSANKCLKLPSEIIGHIIWYQSRSKHIKNKVFLNVGVDKKDADKLIDKYNNTLKCIKAFNFKKLKRVCSKPSEAKRRYCHYSNICFSPIGIEKHLNSAIKMRRQ